jgi:hypothetical protein
MTVSRRAVIATLTDRHFGDGAPTWRVSRGKPSERRCETLAEADSQRERLANKLNWHAKHYKLPVTEQLAVRLRRCGGPKRCRSGACPVCVRAVQRLCVEVGIELDRKERRIP